MDVTDQIRAGLAELRRAESRGVVAVHAADPASEEAVRARETGLEPHFGTVSWSAPPSYRALLALHNGLRCERTVDGADIGFDIVDEDEIAELNADLVHLPEHVSRDDGRYLSTNHLVGFAATGGEAVWCFDVTRPDGTGEYPVHYHHQDDQEGRTRYADSGEWEFPESAAPDFPSFAAWFTAMTRAIVAPEPPEWCADLGAPGPLLAGAEN